MAGCSHRRRHVYLHADAQLGTTEEDIRTTLVLTSWSGFGLLLSAPKAGLSVCVLSCVRLWEAVGMGEGFTASPPDQLLPQANLPQGNSALRGSIRMRMGL